MLTVSHKDLKQFDKRTEVESAKVKTLAKQIESFKKQMDAEKKAYSVDLKKAVEQYAQNDNLTPQFKQVLADYGKGLDKVGAVHDTAGLHVQEVAVNALGFLPKKFENHKKTLKLAEKVPESVHKLKDFEFERIQYTRQALLHFLNA